MDLFSMRCDIADAYPGKGWKVQCAIMPENQVIAIYKRFEEDGVFKKRKQLEEESKKAKDYRQLDLFKDFGISRR